MHLEILKIEGKEDIPEVILDYSAGRIEFSGKSLPEDVQEIYNPIIAWVEKYVQQPQKHTHVVFKMDYFNTASSKKILDVLEIVKEIDSNGNELKIDWYYPDNDEDMQDAGNSFSEFIDIPFNMISY